MRTLLLGVTGALAPVLLAGTLTAAVALQTDPAGCGTSTAGASSSGPALAAQVAAAAGFTGDDLVVAVAVAGAESGYQPTVRNSIGASGLWQILQSAHPDLFTRYNWRDPTQNALMAHAVWTSAGHSWTPWTTWTSGAYLTHLDEARAAVQEARQGGGEPCADGSSLSPAVPFTGPDGYVDDPTSSGQITRRMLHTFTEVNRVFGGWPWPIGCWDPHPWNPTSDHPRGRACDFTVGHLGQYPSAAERATGWLLAHWLQANANPLGITYVIWDGRIWSPTRAGEGWRRYDGAGIYDPSSPTGGHHDHVHASVN